MKEARHIATGRIRSASEVDYSGYHGIFQCPHCKVALRLRKEYITPNGTTRTAAFIHPPGETELEKKCPYRINMNFSATKPQIGFPNSREQCFKLLKKNFLKCLKNYSKVGIIESYSKDQEALESIGIFMDLNHKIISARQNGRYILELQESQKIQNLLRDKEYQRINSYSEDSIQSRLNFVKKESNSLIWGLEFIINEANEDFMQKALDYIFGKYIETYKINFIEFENNFFEQMFPKHKIDMGVGSLSFGRIKKVFGFELSIIKQANEVLSNDKLINNFFEQMYTKQSPQSSDSNAVLFNEITKIHNQVFDYIIDYLVNFPWHCLLY